MHRNKRSPEFSRALACAPDAAQVVRGALPVSLTSTRSRRIPAGPHLRAIRFRGGRLLTGEDISCRDMARASSGSFSQRCRLSGGRSRGCLTAADPQPHGSSCWPRAGILTGFPFAVRGWRQCAGRPAHATRNTPARSRHSNLLVAQDRLTLGPMRLPRKPSPSVRLQGFHLNTCYYHQDLHWRRFHPGSRAGLLHDATSRPPTHARMLCCEKCRSAWRGISSPLERHPFSGLVHSAGELLHTPWRVPTSMATVLLSGWTNTLYGVWWADIWTL